MRPSDQLYSFDFDRPSLLENTAFLTLAVEENFWDSKAFGNVQSMAHLHEQIAKTPKWSDEKATEALRHRRMVSKAQAVTA